LRRASRASPEAAMTAIVTFCNTAASGTRQCALVSLSTGNVRAIELGDAASDHGATGLACTADGDVIVALPGSMRLVRLSSTLEPVDEFFDASLTDVHSIAMQGDSLYAVATARDSVLEYNVLSGGYELRATHQLSDGPADTLHINSICFHQGRVLISMFGEDWRTRPASANTGSIVDLADRRSVSGSLSHPHSLTSAGDDLYILGSFSGTVEKVLSNGDRTVCARHAGYLRGLSIFENGALVGVSGRRRRSRGLGTSNAVDPAFDDRCGLLWFNREWELKRFVDLSWFGREIYDIALAGGPAAVPTIDDTLAVAKSRISQLEESWAVAAEMGAPAPGAPDEPMGADRDG
jgi:hypothetical protein